MYVNKYSDVCKRGKKKNKGSMSDRASDKNGLKKKKKKLKNKKLKKKKN